MPLPILREMPINLIKILIGERHAAALAFLPDPRSDSKRSRARCFEVSSITHVSDFLAVNGCIEMQTLAGELPLIGDRPRRNVI